MPRDIWKRAQIAISLGRELGFVKYLMILIESLIPKIYVALMNIRL